MHIKKDYLPNNKDSFEHTGVRQFATFWNPGNEKQAFGLGSVGRNRDFNGIGDIESFEIEGEKPQHFQNQEEGSARLPGKKTEEKHFHRSYQAPKINRAPVFSLLGALLMVGL